MNVENIAAICHEMNRAYCNHLGDESQVCWDEAPEWQQAGTIKAVELKLQDPWLTAGQMHEHWLLNKRAEGWIYGNEKNAELKTHPCVLPWEELPKEHKFKDVLFAKVVEQLAPFIS